MPWNNVRLGFLLALACAAAMSSCGGDSGLVSPSSPTSIAAPPRANLSVRPLDYHEPAPMPEPSPEPLPGPGPVPEPAPVTPIVTISIVGSFGSGAFAPNPIPAAVGSMLVWANNDATVHRIVLSDGTAVGTLAPGQASAPIPLTTATASYHCTIHPSMTGSIQDPSAPPPVSEPPPVYDPPYGPPEDPYDDPYYDGYSNTRRIAAARSR